MTLDELLNEIEQSAFVRYVALSYSDALALYERERQSVAPTVAFRLSYALQRARAHNVRMAHLATLQ